MQRSELDLLSDWLSHYLGLDEKSVGRLAQETAVALCEAKFSIIHSKQWWIRIETDRGDVELSPVFQSREEAVEWLREQAPVPEYAAKVVEWLHSLEWSLTLANGGRQERWTVEAE